LPRNNAYFLALAVLLFASVVLLSMLGVQNLAVYLSVFSLCYFANSFVFRPKRRTFDFVGLGLLYYTLLLLGTAFKV
jgi:hypothetical protein